MRTRNLLSTAAQFTIGLFLVIVLTCGIAVGQGSTATIRGTVTDSQGNLVPGATVIISNAATNFSRTAVSTNDGVFTLEQIPVGDYRLEVEANGFKKAVIPEVHALVAKVTPVDVSLEVGNVSETVKVDAGVGQL